MKLTDLEPRWVTFGYVPPEDEGKKWHIGLTFLCPHCKVMRLAVFFEPELDDGYGWKFRNWDSYKEIKAAHHIWNRISGETFESLSLSPSVDASVEGHWHGHITNGEVR